MIRREVVLRGVVQGVGFRPHVLAVASRHAVTGFVGNDAASVFVELQGSSDAVAACQQALQSPLPPLATVLEVRTRNLPVVVGEASFSIVASRGGASGRTLLPPDTATCDDCLADMADPANRRHGYAFTTCTNCGPRLSIIRDVPYDRPLTTMANFPLCPDCAREYAEPDDRRHHAQPISCYACGPRLWLTDAVGAVVVGDPGGPQRSTSEAKRVQDAVLDAARTALASGQILAVKGIGGFHLMCDARSDAVARLRARKRGSAKPFAVMVGSVDAARRLADLTELDERELASAARPIVLAPKASGYDLSDAVASGLNDIGLLLPYSPVHALLLNSPPLGSQQPPASAPTPLVRGGVVVAGQRQLRREPGDGLASALLEASLALVATSGNAAEEPLCFENDDALARLAGLCDGFLLHDRGIHVPVEDSVVRTPLGPIRRSRGYAPLPVLLPARPALPVADVSEPPPDVHADRATSVAASGRGPSHGPAGRVVLAVGGELKNTFCLVNGDLAHLSAHTGDARTLPALRAFERSVAQLIAMTGAEPGVVVCDLHPGYSTTSWAERYADARGLPLLRVQHHHAHALALLAEHRIATGKAVIATLDGTGYGTDGTIWGGEVLTVDASSTRFERSWHVPSYPLVGGDRAIKQPWRAALGLACAWGIDIDDMPMIQLAPSDEIRVVRSALASGTGVAMTSSAGRLFDAASALLGICPVATYEAQAAMELERAATEWSRVCGRITVEGRGSGPDACVQLIEDLLDGRREVGEQALRFHLGLASIVSDAVATAASASGTDIVGLTGGCALNRLLFTAIVSDLKGRGLRVLTHRRVPAGDGGLSLGHAWFGVLAREFLG